jgi:hypothetical protein
MKSHLGELEAGEFVALNGTGVDADLVLHYQGLIKGGMAEDHLFSEIMS